MGNGSSVRSGDMVIKGTILVSFFLLLSFLIPPQQANTFSDTFDGNPAVPVTFTSPKWDVVTHIRDVEYWDNPKIVVADHGDDCTPPPATHSQESGVYQCKNHIMTALDGGNYGMTYLTPVALLDFTNTTATITFDMSTLRTSNRDWIDVWIIPEQDDIILPLEAWLPDATGNPKNAIHIRMTDPGNASTRSFFFAEIIRNFQVEHIIQDQFYIDEVTTPSALVRSTFKLEISKTSLKFGMPDYNRYWINTNVNPALTWSTGMVQIGHHSYNPTKDGGIPGTWHIDNFSMQPIKPKGIIYPDSRVVTVNGNTVHLPAPTTVDTRMRFNGYVGDYVDVTFDTSNPVRVLATASEKPETRDHFRTFWVDVPIGTQTISFNGPSGFLYWRIKDISLWYDVIETPTSTNTITPTVTLTPTETLVPTQTPIVIERGTIVYEDEDVIVIRK